MFVCRFWGKYIQNLVHKDVYIRAYSDRNNLPKWRNFLKFNPSKAKHVQSMHIGCVGVDFLYSALLLTQKLQGLKSLYISYWDLSKEPLWIYRAAACMTSLTHLHLNWLKDCTALQLIKLISSFCSLSKLSIVFNSTQQQLERKKQPLPKSHKLHMRSSLVYLEIKLIPGISTFLDWLIKTDSFAANLKQLTLLLWDEDEFQCKCDGIAKFLDYCGGSLEEFTLQTINVFSVDGLADLGMYILTTKLQMILFKGVFYTKSP